MRSSFWRGSQVSRSNRITEENPHRSHILIYVSRYIIHPHTLIFRPYLPHYVFRERARHAREIFFVCVQLELQMLYLPNCTALYCTTVSVDRKVIRREVILVTAGHPIWHNNIISFVRHAESAGFPSRNIRFHISVYTERGLQGLVSACGLRSFRPGILITT